MVSLYLGTIACVVENTANKHNFVSKLNNFLSKKTRRLSKKRKRKKPSTHTHQNTTRIPWNRGSEDFALVRQFHFYHHFLRENEGLFVGSRQRNLSDHHNWGKNQLIVVPSSCVESHARKSCRCTNMGAVFSPFSETQFLSLEQEHVYLCWQFFPENSDKMERVPVNNVFCNASMVNYQCLFWANCWLVLVLFSANSRHGDTFCSPVLFQVLVVVFSPQEWQFCLDVRDSSQQQMIRDHRSKEQHKQSPSYSDWKFCACSKFWQSNKSVVASQKIQTVLLIICSCLIHFTFLSWLAHLLMPYTVLDLARNICGFAQIQTRAFQRIK